MVTDQASRPGVSRAGWLHPSFVMPGDYDGRGPRLDLGFREVEVLRADDPRRDDDLVEIGRTAYPWQGTIPRDDDLDEIGRIYGYQVDHLGPFSQATIARRTRVQAVRHAVCMAMAEAGLALPLFEERDDGRLILLSPWPEPPKGYMFLLGKAGRLTREVMGWPGEDW